MIQSQYIPIEGKQKKKIHIQMDEPISRKKIANVHQVNPQFGFIKFSDGSEDEVLFSDCEQCFISEDTLTIYYDAENRLEEYTIDQQSFLFEAKLDTIPPTVASKYWVGNEYILHFSEPILHSDSLKFESQIDSIWNTVTFNIVDDRNIHLLISEENRIRFWGTHITDLYNNQFQDSLVEILFSQQVIPEEKTILGGNVKGLITYKFINEIVVEAESISSTESTFIISNDGEFEFINLESGKYILKAFENKNELNSDVYFSGVWNPYKTAATYAIYGDTINVRSTVCRMRVPRPIKSISCLG